MLCKKTYQYDLDGNFIREWESVAAIGRELLINKTNISACCLHKKLTSDGYIWQYADDVQLEEHLVDRRSKTQKKIGACKPVLQFSKDGTFIQEYESLKQAEQQIGIDHLGQYLNDKYNKGNRHTCGGYIFEYKNPEDIEKTNTRKARQVKQYTVNKEFIQEYPSVSAGARGISVPSPNITRACQKHCKTGGFYWAYSDDNWVEQ